MLASCRPAACLVFLHAGFSVTVGKFNPPVVGDGFAGSAVRLHLPVPRRNRFGECGIMTESRLCGGGTRLADRVVLVRHGMAELISATGTDDGRCLTGRGRAALIKGYPQFFPSLMEGDDVPSVKVMASSAVRTRQTAEVICDVLGLPSDGIEISRALTAQDDAAIEDEIRQEEGTVVAVGHSPSMDEVASRMSGRMRTMLRGEALCLDMAGGRNGRGTVLWDCRPR